MSGRCLVALKDFVGHDAAGEFVEIHAGITYVSDDWSGLRDPAIRSLFKDEGSAAGKIAIRTAGTPRLTTSNTKSGSKRVPIRRMRGEPCDVQVLLSDEVIDGISRSVFWSTGRDGLESGGWLSGTGLDRALAVLNAAQSNVDEMRTPHSMRLDLTNLEWTTKLRASGHEHAPIGCYHSHPNGDLTPSPKDFSSWEVSHEYANIGDWQPYTAGIIVTPDENGRWVHPTLHAWVTRDEGDRYVTQPARIATIDSYLQQRAA